MFIIGNYLYIFLFFGTDKKNYRIPVLLNCGHDLCRICFKFMSKTNKSIICEICQAHTM